MNCAYCGVKLRGYEKLCPICGTPTSEVLLAEDEDAVAKKLSNGTTMPSRASSRSSAHMNQTAAKWPVRLEEKDESSEWEEVLETTPPKHAKPSIPAKDVQVIDSEWELAEVSPAGSDDADEDWEEVSKEDDWEEVVEEDDQDEWMAVSHEDDAWEAVFRPGTHRGNTKTRNYQQRSFSSSQMRFSDEYSSRPAKKNRKIGLTLGIIGLLLILLLVVAKVVSLSTSRASANETPMPTNTIVAASIGESDVANVIMETTG